MCVCVCVYACACLSTHLLARVVEDVKRQLEQRREQPRHPCKHEVDRRCIANHLLQLRPKKVVEIFDSFRDLLELREARCIQVKVSTILLCFFFAPAFALLLSRAMKPV